MKKKIETIILLIFISMGIGNTSMAMKAGSIAIESSKQTIKKGEEVEITISISDSKTAAFNFSLSFDNLKLEVISQQENMNITNDRILFVWYDTTGGKGAKQGELAKFRFKAKEEGLATFTLQGEFYSQTGQLMQTNSTQTQIQIGKEKSDLQAKQEEQGTNSQNDNANLQVLRLNQEGMVPSFEKDTYEYDITIPNQINEIEVLAISENPNSQVEVIGNTNLEQGLNVITIQVTSQDKTKKNVYTIQVTKTEKEELANTNLEILAIENVLLNPPFANDETNYYAEVSNGIQNLNLLAVPENEQATVSIMGKDNLQVGNNKVSVEVTAPNGFTKRKYQVEVKRRNEEEEAKIQEEEKNRIEKWEEAYKIEEISSKEKQEQETIQTEEKQEDENRRNALIAVAIITIVLIGILIYNRKRKKTINR